MFKLDQHTAFVAIACGVIAALLSFAPFVAGSVGLVLSTFTAAPLFVAALGFGTAAGVVSGLVAGLATMLFLSPGAAIGLIFITAGPAIWIGHLAGLVNEHDEWFPASGIFVRMVAISAAITVIFTTMIEANADAFRETINQLLTVLQTQNPDFTLQTNREETVERVLRSLPPFLAAGLLVTFAINLTLAENITRKRGWILRPRDVKAFATALPVWAVPVLAITVIIAAFTDGQLSAAALAVSGATAMGFFLVGLASVHAFARSFNGGRVLLFVTYGLIIISGPLIFLIILILTLLGVAETLLNLRSRVATPTQ